MSDAAFYEPYLAATVRTPFLGCVLRPLSLGHLLLLHSLDSAFVPPVKDALFDDLAVSVFICCNTYENALANIGTKKLKKELAKWQKALGVFDLNAACHEFQDYIARGMVEPLHRWHGEGGRAGTTPKAQGIKVTLMHKLGYREAELLDRPYRICLLDWFTYHANEGNLSFTSPEEVEELKAIARMTPEELDAALAKQREARNGTP